MSAPAEPSENTGVKEKDVVATVGVASGVKRRPATALIPTTSPTASSTFPMVRMPALASGRAVSTMESSSRSVFSTRKSAAEKVKTSCTVPFLPKVATAGPSSWTVASSWAEAGMAVRAASTDASVKRVMRRRI